MTRPNGLFASAIGRRLLALFFVAAFVPIVVMMTIAVMRVDHAVESALEEELTQAAKSHGMQLIDRLVHLETLLDEAALDEAVFADAQQQPAGRFKGFTAIAVLSAEGAVLRQAGDFGAPLPASLFDTARLAAGKSALLKGREPGSKLLMVRRVQSPRAGARIAVAAPEPRGLWGDPDNHPALTDFAIATASGLALHASHAIDFAAFDWSRLARGGAQSLRWEDKDGTLRASAWTLFVESRFAGEDWVIMALRSEREALRTAQAFRSAFISAVVLALLLVVLVSTTQIRRILVPLQRLLAGTRKVARNDYGARIEVDGRDEFGQLAQSFNEMAQRIGLQFRTFDAFAEIDRSILTTLDLGDVGNTAAHCVRELAGVKMVSVALIEPGSSDRLRVYGHTYEAADAPEFTWDPASVAATAHLEWTAQPPLPQAYVELLRNHGARQFALLPVARGAFASGVVVLADERAQPMPAESAAQIGGVVDRLAIALAAVARDRKLHEQAHFDGLTGLPNRYYLLSLVAQALARAQREKSRLAVLFVDLDNFKRTNDTLGHAAGDRILQAAALRIRGAVREGDIVARLGGDEFTIVLDQLADPQTAGAVAQKTIDVLSEPFEADGQDMYLGASIGIAVYPNDGATADELLKRADTAMYRAKAVGRGSYAFFEERMNVEANERARIDRELRLALQRDELVLHFQPQLDLQNGRIDGAEALVRWQHPQRGLLAPGAFIAVAEESGLIDALGLWVLDHACEELARWRNEQLGIEHIAVNVSSRQLQRPDFYGRVEQALERNRLPPAALVLEVTESLFADATLVEVLRRLEALGVRIAVDDFGTGYSSFAYLRSLPISILKIDRTFIIDIETDAGAATVAGAIVKMAQALGKEVVAEGVETGAQRDFLRSARCERIQGYVLSRPVDAQAFRRFVRESSREKIAAAAAPVEAPAAADA